MAKGKAGDGAPNKHLRARVAYLHQVATYLTSQTGVTANRENDSAATLEDGNPGIQDSARTSSITVRNINGRGKPNLIGPSSDSNTLPVARSSPLSSGSRLSSHLKQVARKSQIRLDHNTKHSICKRCSTVLVDGSSCQAFVENRSKDQKKAHANVAVKQCGVCGAQKRWPVGATRQSKASTRRGNAGNDNADPMSAG
ncbi:RNAse P Rpr2/Rpp21/SNM1 subunit domain-containing protein [Neohortaea acidophila]|uniref:RNAse P Rpr2/Rpp21/SNM1 subunit domain-containing protein n=1 Tax=Neohortaea acidophila TaxID=245834 RepID=A0A6A6PHI2_9PEZI|nr:RNAse P Rpr2/Rpp21/SNM1 subunit domain-containing protein [Neohortaea acidophila]KAF2479375.1 RNAse P Rpr2/Rpp21/SNM1 subunit domain-containing protein [Neohortaea acidophila]